VYRGRGLEGKSAEGLYLPGKIAAPTGWRVGPGPRATWRWWVAGELFRAWAGFAIRTVFCWAARALGLGTGRAIWPIGVGLGPGPRERALANDDKTWWYMPLKNACFISFRNGQYDLTNRFVTDLHRGLCNELEAQLGRGIDVFFDQERLKGGYFFNEVIAEELCQSACLVLVYTPSYFDVEHAYCAREYRGMLKLEEQRLALLKDDIKRTHGLIVPVVFRGDKYLPAEIGSVRHSYNFDQFSLSDRCMSKHKKYAPVLTEIADYIAERYRDLSPQLTAVDCTQFTLPSVDDIKPWLVNVTAPPMPLPGRSK